MPTMDFTHDIVRRSWIDTANQPDGDFPLQNLPYGVFRTPADPAPRPGAALGDRILDLRAAAAAGLLPEAATVPCSQPDLNALMAAGAPVWSALRARLSELLGTDTCPAGEQRDRTQACLVPQRGAELLLPAQIGDYTDFYASIHHATNVGSMFRPESPLLPNYKWVPVGYHGRCSSLVPSGTSVRRPSGQMKPAELPAPVYGPTRNLDYELELGVFVGPGNRPGERIPLAAAPSHLFGIVLLNDWSARDIQAWEYQPLGPFLSKNFATTISPWVVTMEALAPFRVPATPRPAGDPVPLPYLTHATDIELGGLDLTLEVSLLTAQMRLMGDMPYRMTRGNSSVLYWTLAQLLTHHASNGCHLRPGDLLGSGTISGPARETRGCLLELTWRGTDPVRLPNGEERRFLADGDEVILRGYAERPGARRIGLGECRGVVLPAN
ncbi:MAG: fumarylacetoacetase [Opitutales bacterium]